jgi:hypothetical protein
MRLNDEIGGVGELGEEMTSGVSLTSNVVDRLPGAGQEHL